MFEYIYSKLLPVGSFKHGGPDVLRLGADFLVILSVLV
jgi:hypothetical protein